MKASQTGLTGQMAVRERIKIIGKRLDGMTLKNVRMSFSTLILTEAVIWNTEVLFPWVLCEAHSDLGRICRSAFRFLRLSILQFPYSTISTKSSNFVLVIVWLLCVSLFSDPDLTSSLIIAYCTVCQSYNNVNLSERRHFAICLG
jgi:hypothetical protein